MIRAHRKALESMVPAEWNLALYVGKVPANTSAPSRYAVLHFMPGMATPTAYDSETSDWREWPFVTHAYGADAEQVQWVQERLEEAWLDKRPTVVGRQCGAVRRVGAGVPPEPDNDTIPPIILARDSWAFDSIPA